MAVKNQEYLAESFFTSPPAYDDDDDNDSTMSNGSSPSSSSSSSTDNTTDDAISPPSLYDFSELMDQLPIKRGLSMFYKGKSESFMSLSKVSSLDDLKKKENPYSRRRRRRRSCRTTKNSSRSYLPNPTSKFKKTPRASSSFSSSSFQSKRVSLVCRRNTPPKMTFFTKGLER